MTTFEEMLAKRPIPQGVLEAKVQKMHEEARLYRLKQMRKENGLTQSDLAKLMGTSQHRVSQIENGKITTAQVGTLQRYIEALGGTLSLFVESPDGTNFSIPASTYHADLATT